MFESRKSHIARRRIRWPSIRALLWSLATAAVIGGTVKARDILMSGNPAAAAPAATGTTGGTGTIPATTAGLPNAQDRLARTLQALQAVQNMQDAARKLAVAGPNNLKVNLPAVPVNSYGQTNGLVLASGVPKDLTNPAATENAALWTGANLPTLTTQTATDGTVTSAVTIKQTQQQALLNWQSFNIGKNTTLTFDQGAGGASVGQWIAFNLIRDPTGNPTQILGSLRTIGAPDAKGNATSGGQLYLMNSNGIIFGGSSQVNTHALVASSLPINYSLIQQGLLNNPDSQFLFSALPQPAGSSGPTPAFDPATASPDGHVPEQTPLTADGSYGDVVVQPGAVLTAPTSADHVGGRIALVGPNVTNAGTISTADGQTILAAGLQVAFAAHNSSDATQRGLDVYVGKVADDSLPNQAAAGSVTNAGLDAANLGTDLTGVSTATTNPNQLNALGLISAARGDVYVTGKNITQSGFIDSSTSVAYNGRVDLVAAYNAVQSPYFNKSQVSNPTLKSRPFVFQSSGGDDPIAGTPVQNTGQVTLGQDSVLQILPETASTERVVGDLALPSQVNIQGQAVTFAANSILLAPGAVAPLSKPAFGIDGTALPAGVTISAGTWFLDNNQDYNFVHSDDAQQIKLSSSSLIDVAGMADVAASVTENIVSVQLRGSELANSPLQRNGALRGQTVQVDIRQHGPWDPTLNGGLGGYTWVGTPLADTAGWVGLTTHSVGELTVNGGSVALQAGGAVQLESGSTINVSGGSIDYQGGTTQTTKVVANGHIYDISKATPDRVYDSIYTGTTTTTDPKWGTTTSNANPLPLGVYENGYTQGGNGGSLAITAPAVTLAGALQGNTIAGKYQQTLSPVYNPGSPPSSANPVVVGASGWLLGALNLPVPGQLALTFQRQYFKGDPATATDTGYFNYSPTPPDIIIASTVAPGSSSNDLYLAPGLFSNSAGGSGFGILRIDDSADNANYDFNGNNLASSARRGSITVAFATNLALPTGGSLSLSAGNVTVEQLASVSAPGGSISLKAYDLSPNQAAEISLLASNAPTPPPVYDFAQGNVVIQGDTLLSAAGEVQDNRAAAPGSGSASAVTGGGSIALAGNQIILAGAYDPIVGTPVAASILDVSGGAVISGSGKFSYGSGGKISISAGKYVGGGVGAFLGGTLDLGATLRGYAGLGQSGGKLTLQVPSISIQNLTGGATTATDAATGALDLAPAFFSTGGFSSFSLTGLGVAVSPSGLSGVGGPWSGPAPAFAIASGTTIQPAVQNWLLQPGGPIYTAPTGLQNPVTLNFTASDILNDILGTQLNNTALVMDANSTIVTNPLGSVSLNGNTVDVLGTITAPGGSIAVSQTGAPASGPTVHFGPGSVLDASGTTVYTADANGYHAKDVVDGGKITITGNIVAEGAGVVKDAGGSPLVDAQDQPVRGLGAEFNVAGADGMVQLLPGQNSIGSPVPTGLVSAEKQSNGGTLTFNALNELFIADDARLLGGPGLSAGGGTSTAQGGDLVVSARTVSTVIVPADVMLDVTQKAPGFHYTGLGQGVTDATGQSYGDAQGLGVTRFGVDNFTQGGFGALTLSTTQAGAIQIDGDVAVSANRQVTIADQGILSFAAGAVGSKLTLDAPYVAIGAGFQPPSASGPIVHLGSTAVSPQAGNGTLLVRAGTLIDVGDLSVQNASAVTLDATYQGQTGVTNGAIRGDGTLDVAGTVTLKAGQIYPPSGTTFNVIAADYTDYSSDPAGTTVAGTVNILPAGTPAVPALPLSAGGNLNVYASTINQGGVLRAPQGSINLGVGSGGAIDPLSGQGVPSTSTLNLLPGSVTSVSAVDPATGHPVTVPYGITVNGDTWIDPTGTDITTGGPVAKKIMLTAADISFQAATAKQPAAKVDQQGGGDLSAYQFVPGTGGTNDILGAGASAATGAFAIVPSFTDAAAPFGSYATTPAAGQNLGSDAGYVIGNPKQNYQVGDRIHLEAGAGLPAGEYTLLPARYALMPGAYLLTPLTATAATAGAASSVAKPDGSSVVAGYRYNGLDQSGGGTQTIFSSFEIAPLSVVQQRAQYDVVLANTFFAGQAVTNNTVAPRLPVDAGQLVLAAGNSLSLQGTILAGAPTGGRGGLIDISSPADIFIGSQSTLADPPAGLASNALFLDASELSSFGAESLLIGGVRTTGAGATQVNVTTGNLTVDNAGEALTGTDVILVANHNLSVLAGSEVHSTGTLARPVDTLEPHGTVQLQPTATDGGNSLTLVRGGGAVTFPNGTPNGDTLTADVGFTLTHPDGTSTTVTTPTNGVYLVPSLSPGDSIALSGPGQIIAAITADGTGSPIPVALGDGVLLRVSSDAKAQITRSNVAAAAGPTLTVGQAASITGSGVILDSTNATSIDETATISGQSVSLDSGRISLQLTNAGTLPSDAGLVLTGTTLQTLQTGAKSLSLLSYSTLDLYGSGTVGGLDAAGQPVLANLGLHAGAIRGYTDPSDPTAGITLAAKTITLDNSANDNAVAPGGTPAGTLTFAANTVDLGSNQLEIQNFSTVTMNASGGVLTGNPDVLGGKNGGLNVIGGDLTINAPLIAGVVGTNQSIAATSQTVASGGQSVSSGGKLALLPAGGAAVVSPGLGASLTLTGAAVEIDTAVKLPSGILAAEATSGDLTVQGGTLDVSGTAQQFYDVTKYTDGGRIVLTADNGSLTVGSGSKLSVAAQAGGGSAGTLAVSAPLGSLSVAVDTLAGQAGAAGKGGTFSLDAQGLPGDDATASRLAVLGQTLLDGGFDRSITLRVRQGDVVADGTKTGDADSTLRAHDIAIAADHGAITVEGTIDASGLAYADSSKPAVDPTGGTIDLSASGSVVLAPTAALTAAGYAYDNAGKGGTITLSAGGYTAGQVNTAAIVDVQAGAKITLGVKNQFTTDDMALTPAGGITPVDSGSGLPTDGTGGTLHLRESQVAFGNGAQFNSLGGSVAGASRVVLEGFQVFDLTGSDGAISTTGAVTGIGSGGLITGNVESAVQSNGAAFVADVANTNAGLTGDALFHVQPGAEIVTTTPVSDTVTNQFVVFNASGTAGGSVLSVSIKPGATVTVNVAGSMPAGDSVRFTAPVGTTCTVTYADGTTSKAFNPNSTIQAISATTGSPVVAFNFTNKKTATGQLAFFSGSTPFVFALGSPATAPVVTTKAAPGYVVHAGDLTLANTWDLSTYRFGPNNEPGNLTLRAPGNLIFGFDASLSDGFDPANASNPKNPLWTAPLIAPHAGTGPDSSWSYQLVAGADFAAADFHAVQPLGTLAANAGSVLVGLGGVALPTATGSSATSNVIIPQYYQTIRTGTGDIDISAGRDVQLLNPLATIYTAGTQAAVLPGFAQPNLNLLGAVSYPPSYSQSGGDVAIRAQNDIVRYVQDSTGSLVAASSAELPNNWLYRRGLVGPDGKFATLTNDSTGGTSFTTEIQSTSWWVDFSNFFDDVGALGGGNVKLTAGRNVTNVSASVPTNARMPGMDATGNPIKPDATALVELGGGDLTVRAGANIDGGVYYVERGDANAAAGGSIHSNPTRSVFGPGISTFDPVQWLPTTFFLGKGSVDVVANGDILLGPVANTFLLPQSANNTDYERTFFSTYAATDTVKVTSFSGRITLQDNIDGGDVGPMLTAWYLNVLTGSGASQPWLRALDFGSANSIIDPFSQVAALLPGTLRVTAFSNDINLVGSSTLAPSPTGTLDLLTSGNINGLAVNGAAAQTLSWGTAAINLSDASPASLPGVGAPLAFSKYTTSTSSDIVAQVGSLLNPVNLALTESGGTNLTLAEKLARHGSVSDAAGRLVPLHANDPDPVHLYAVAGDISGLTFYSGKPARIVAGQDITDVAFYVQNVRATDVTIVAASHDIIAYDPASPLRTAAQQPGNILNQGAAGETGVASPTPDAGDIQVAGPGSLEVLAGRNLDLGAGADATKDGTAAGITSVGSIRNTILPQNSGASIVATAGVGSVYTPAASALTATPGLASTGLDFIGFINKFLNPDTAGTEATRYLPQLATLMDLTSTDPTQIWAAFGFKPGQALNERQALMVQDMFQLVLRNSARDRNNPGSPAFGSYTDGFAAIAALFPGSPQPTDADLKSTVPVIRPAGPWTGQLSLPTKEIKTFEGGDIFLLVPGGDITVGRATDPQKPDQGIITERAGNVSIYAADNVGVGTSRIFTLRGGNEIIWSTWGNIAAGSGSKTVFSAPPTRVLIDPQSGDVQNDLAGLATGSGIGVLATLSGVKPGDVDLIAPVGTIDAGDAGIRSSGNLNLAARVVLNASNIQVGGTSVGTPPPPPAPNLGSLNAAASASAGASSAATEVAGKGQESNQVTELPSLISVEVLGYGGGDDDDDDRRKKAANSTSGAG